MNIAIIGFDYEFVLKLATEISLKLELEVVDFKKEFEKVLLEINHLLLVENEIFQVEEAKLLKELSNKKNLIIAVPDDVVFSNKNYKYLKNNYILYINSNNLNNFQKNLKKLIKNKINLEINQEKFNFNEIINNIRGYYEG